MTRTIEPLEANFIRIVESLGLISDAPAEFVDTLRYFYMCGIQDALERPTGTNDEMLHEAEFMIQWYGTE